MTTTMQSVRFAGMGIVLLCASVHADLILEVHPFKPPTQLVAAFAPLADYLSGKLGQPVTVRIAKDYQTHIEAIGNDAVDLAYLGPVAYVKLRAAYGPRPLLARQQIGNSPVFHGKIFVRQNSPLQTLADLKGQRFAFTEPHSTMGYLVPRYQLWQAGIPVERLATYQFLGDHVNVALGVLTGDYDAGAVKEDVFELYKGRGLRHRHLAADLRSRICCQPQTSGRAAMHTACGVAAIAQGSKGCGDSNVDHARGYGAGAGARQRLRHAAYRIEKAENNRG